MNIRRLNIVLHRDIGYFFSGLIIIYCISGLALNHVEDWNPDFIIQKKTIKIPGSFSKDSITAAQLSELNNLVGETHHKIYDIPAPGHTKIYYDNATLHIDMNSGTGVYEKIVRRPLVYETNILHRNTLKGWRWVSDIFSVMLIFISISGWFMLKGKNGIIGRGKWLIAAGMIPPVVAVVIFNLLQQ